MNRFFNWVVLAVVVGLVSSCGLYHRNIQQDGGKFQGADDYVIQVDDHGSFWAPEVATKALRDIANSAQNTNTIVLLFIHGWHHNAETDDDNAKDFAKSLASIRQKLDDNIDGNPGVYRRSRINLTSDGNVRVIGIYVGWRGKSLPMPLNFLTFWGRKATAERVGEGDLKEFLTRLNGIYRQQLAARESAKGPFMGLISFGHSFGGQVLFKAVAGEIERELISVATIPNAQGLPVTLRAPISGFGTMTVLINPALESFQYDRIHRLSRQFSYDSRQPPVLLVVSSETDLARRYLFPIGRTLAMPFGAPLRDSQSDMWTTALGEFEPQRTHRIDIVEKPPIAFDADDYISKKCEVIGFDLTSIPSIAGVQLTPLESRGDRYSPFLVAYVSGKVVIQHSGIFEERLRNFLNDYVALAQGKRVLLADPEGANCLKPVQ